MTNLLESIKRLFTPVKPLSPGIFHYQAPPDAPTPYRLHLRLEPDGTGILIVNASTILHLNQTAAEYAYHMIMQTPEDKIAGEISSRYRINRQHALQDYQLQRDHIQSLVNTPDLDPETFLDFERSTPYSKKISAPYRLDCAITYKLPVTSEDSLAPNRRVDRELSTEEWFGVFDKAWGFGIPHIILTGGEPTLRNDLVDLIAHTESNGQVVGLLTDGIKLSDNIYLQSLLQTGLDHIMILLNPDREESWKSIENVLAADIYLTVHLTITEQNAQNKSKILERLVNLGINTISITATSHDLQKSVTDFRNQIASQGLKLVWDLPVPYSEFNPISLETQQDNPPSGGGHAWLYIEPDGDVLPAQGINQVLGNILKDPWDKLWR